MIRFFAINPPCSITSTEHFTGDLAWRVFFSMKTSPCSCIRKIYYFFFFCAWSWMCQIQSSNIIKPGRIQILQKKYDELFCSICFLPEYEIWLYCTQFQICQLNTNTQLECWNLFQICNPHQGRTQYFFGAGQRNATCVIKQFHCEA